MQIKAFFDKATSTLTYVLFDEATRDAVIIDPVLDFDAASGRIRRNSADEVLTFIKNQQLGVHVVLETHAHADHLSSSQVLKAALPGVKLAIGDGIRKVQTTFKPIYGFAEDFPTDGSQFDRLFRDGERVRVGSLAFDVLFTPGHTAACASYNFDGHVFTGDALFMPDYGTGRADFPGGSASDLYDSITKRLYTLPDETKVFTCHDYQPGGRELKYESTIGEEKRSNVQLTATTSRDEYVSFRNQRDAGLPAPKLLHPSVQINIDGGRLPPAESNGKSYVKIPLTVDAGISVRSLPSR